MLGIFQNKIQRTLYKALLHTRQAGANSCVNACEPVVSGQAWRQGQVAILVDPDTGNHTFHVLTDSLMLSTLAGMLPEDKKGHCYILVPYVTQKVLASFKF